jgi:hypothetical protein
MMFTSEFFRIRERDNAHANAWSHYAHRA